MKLNNITFSGKFQLDANQKMSTKNGCFIRDGVIGFWANRANNYEEVHQKICSFLDQNQKTNEQPLNIIIDIPDESDNSFKESMQMCGQKFKQIG